MTRPNILKGTTPEVKTGCGKMYVVLNHNLEGKIVEILPQIGKAGGCASAQVEAIARLASCLLRRGEPIAEVAAMLADIKCQHHNPAMGVRSCSDALASVLKDVKVVPKAEPTTK